MSQRECAGFNWPPLSIAASEPVSISPEAVSRAGPVSFTMFGSSRLSTPADPRESQAIGVGQLVVVVGHPPQALSDVRRAEARSAQIDRCAGVSRSFQVSAYKVEPAEAVLARNLLTKNDARASLLDEMVEGGP